MLDSWATIYISEAEGFGLPPVESLWLGTPVVASAAIPSLEAIGPAGVHIVEPVNTIELSPRGCLAPRPVCYIFRWMATIMIPLGRFGDWRMHMNGQRIICCTSSNQSGRRAFARELSCP